MKHSASFRFKENVNDFLDFMTDLVRETSVYCDDPIDVNTIVWVSNFIKIYDSDKLIITFINDSYPHWDCIYNESEDYFLSEFFNIFKRNMSEKNEKCLTCLKNILNTKKTGTDDYVVTSDDKEIIWKYLKSFIRISIQYMHEVSVPDYNNDKIMYLNNKFNIDIESNVKKWNITLN